MRLIADAGAYTPPGDGAPNHWAEHFAVTDLSVGTYSIPAGGTDDQEPHTEDEIYVITAGRAVLASGAERIAVQPGSVLYVAAGEQHRFTDITQDLAALVIFAPAYESRAAQPEEPPASS